jgi:hypothetical protein
MLAVSIPSTSLVILMAVALQVYISFHFVFLFFTVPGVTVVVFGGERILSSLSLSLFK